MWIRLERTSVLHPRLSYLWHLSLYGQYWQPGPGEGERREEREYAGSQGMAGVGAAKQGGVTGT